MINQSIGINPNKTRHLGDKFATIDFETFSVTPDNIRAGTPIGELLIGNQRIRLTRAEVDRIIETLVNARSVSDKRYRFGI